MTPPWMHKIVQMPHGQAIAWFFGEEVTTERVMQVVLADEPGQRSSMLHLGQRSINEDSLLAAMKLSEAARDILGPAMPDLLDEQRFPSLYFSHLIGLHPLVPRDDMLLLDDDAWRTYGWLYAHHNPGFLFHVVDGLEPRDHRNRSEECLWETAQRLSLADGVQQKLQSGQLLIDAFCEAMVAYASAHGVKNGSKNGKQLGRTLRILSAASASTMFYRAMMWAAADHPLMPHAPVATVLHQTAWLRERFGWTDVRCLLDRVSA